MIWKVACVLSFGIGSGVVGAWADKTPPKPQPAPTRYEDKQWLYSFQPPTGWKRITENIPKPMVGYAGPNENGFAVNCIVNFHTTLVKRGEEPKFVASVKFEYKKYGTLSEVKSFRHQGNLAYGWRSTLKGANTGFENRQVVFFFQERAYEVTLTYPAATRKKYDPLFEKVVSSFRFGK